MLKEGILNPQIAKVLADTGHMDYLVISDAGLPVPKGIERIDLAWKLNEPRYLPVLEIILEKMVVEKAYLANELKTVSPEMHEKILIKLNGIEIEYITHEKLKEKTEQARAIIRTGEFIPFPSVVLVAGCAY